MTIWWLTRHNDVTAWHHQTLKWRLTMDLWWWRPTSFWIFRPALGWLVMHCNILSRYWCYSNILYGQEFITDQRSVTGSVQSKVSLWLPFILKVRAEIHQDILSLYYFLFVIRFPLHSYYLLWWSFCIFQCDHISSWVVWYISFSYTSSSS